MKANLEAYFERTWEQDILIKPKVPLTTAEKRKLRALCWAGARSAYIARNVSSGHINDLDSLGDLESEAWIAFEGSLKRFDKSRAGVIAESDKRGKRNPKTLQFFFEVYHSGRINSMSKGVRELKRSRGMVQEDGKLVGSSQLITTVFKDGRMPDQLELKRGRKLFLSMLLSEPEIVQEYFVKRYCERVGSKVLAASFPDHTKLRFRLRVLRNRLVKLTGGLSALAIMTQVRSLDMRPVHVKQTSMALDHKIEQTQNIEDGVFLKEIVRRLYSEIEIEFGVKGIAAFEKIALKRLNGDGFTLGACRLSRFIAKWSKENEEILSEAGILIRKRRWKVNPDQQNGHAASATEAPLSSALKSMPFNEARDIVRSMGFKNSDEYRQWAQSPECPHKLSAKPEKTYALKWAGWKNFLGESFRRASAKAEDVKTKPKNATKSSRFMSYDEVKALVRTKGFKNSKEFRQWAKSPDCPRNIPINPEYIYEQWAGWRSFLGETFRKAWQN